MRQPRRLCSDAFENVIDEAVHNAHRLAGDSGVRMHLLEHLVDVNSVALLPLTLLLLISLADVLLSFSGLLHSFAARLWWHDASMSSYSAVYVNAKTVL